MRTNIELDTLPTAKMRNHRTKSSLVRMVRATSSIALGIGLLTVGCVYVPPEEDEVDPQAEGTGAGGDTASTGGTATSTGGSSSGGSDGEFLPIIGESQKQPDGIEACSMAPELGAACDTWEAKCQQPGEAGCASVYTCFDTWSEVESCTGTPLDCPQFTPETGVPCDVPGAKCDYIDSCGEVRTECNDGVWTAVPVPLPECETLCQDMCTRLTECGVTWSSSCLEACRDVHTCSSASEEESVALCQTRAAAIASMDCTALCQEAITGDPALGEDDCTDI